MPLRAAVIVVCGEALVDVIRTPEGHEQFAAGGGPFNTARALSRLGVPTAFLGHLSNDSWGRRLAALLEGDGVGLRFSTVGPEKTTIAVAHVDAEGRATFEFLVDGTSAPNVAARMIPKDLPPEVDAIHIGSLGLALEPISGALLALAARERGRRAVILDPNIRAGLVPDARYRERLDRAIAASTVVKASDADLTWLYHGIDYESAAERMLERGVALAVVTLGAEGAFAAHRDLRVRVSAPNVHVVDTIGAGDAFGAALAAWLHEHARLRPDLLLDEDELRAALGYACLVAAITCTRAGADPPRKSELARGGLDSD